MAVDVKNFDHTKVFPTPSGIRFKRGVHNFSVAVAVLIID
jgi:hypothetical protein